MRFPLAWLVTLCVQWVHEPDSNQPRSPHPQRPRRGRPLRRLPGSPPEPQGLGTPPRPRRSQPVEVTGAPRTIEQDRAGVAARLATMESSGSAWTTSIRDYRACLVELDALIERASVDA